MLIQILIVLFSCTAIWLITTNKPYGKWGYVIGFLGQPLWLYSSYTTNQWGIFVLSLFYMFTWGRGIYNFILKKK